MSSVSPGKHSGVKHGYWERVGEPRVCESGLGCTIRVMKPEREDWTQRKSSWQARLPQESRIWFIRQPENTPPASFQMTVRWCGRTRSGKVPAAKIRSGAEQKRANSQREPVERIKRHPSFLKCERQKWQKLKSFAVLQILQR